MKTGLEVTVWNFTQQFAGNIDFVIVSEAMLETL
jgi:hypothetical protein